MDKTNNRNLLRVIMQPKQVWVDRPKQFCREAEATAERSWGNENEEVLNVQESHLK